LKKPGNVSDSSTGWQKQSLVRIAFSKTEIPMQTGKQQSIIEDQNKKIEMLVKEIKQIKDKLK
jgi:hypothetical protein